MKNLSILILVVASVGILSFAFNANDAPVLTESYAIVFHPRAQSAAFIYYGSDKESENIPFKFKTNPFNGIIDTLNSLNEKGYRLESVSSTDMGEVYTMSKKLP